jgi:hypothetical protein
MEHNVKRIQAPMTSIRQDIVKPKPTSQTPQKQITSSRPAPVKVTHKHAEVEICEKHQSYKVAYEATSG